MAAPITWRNVDGGPNPAAAAIPLAYSQQSINGAFDAFSNILRQREAAAQSTAAASGEAAKQAFLDQLAQARTPEQLAAMQASGELDAARQALSPLARVAVRGADEARLTSLRQQTTATQAYDEQQRALAERPLRDSIASDVALNNFDGAIEKVEASSLGDKAVVLGGINKARRDLAQQIYADADANARRVQTAAESAQRMKLGELSLKEALQKDRDATTSRELDADVNAQAAAYQTRIANMRSMVDEATNKFTGFPVPRRIDGTIDMSAMEPKQLDQLDAYLTSQGLPSLDVVEAGNTEAMASLLSNLRGQGVKPSELARVQAQLPTLFSTTPVTAIGNDAQTIAVRNAQQDALEADAQSRLGVVYTPGTAKDLMTVGGQAIDSLRKQGTWRNGEYRRQLSEWLSEQGIKTKDKAGNEVRVLPSPETLTMLIQRIDQDWFGDMGGNDLKNELTRWAESTEAKEGAKTLMESNLRKMQRTVLNATK